MARPKTTNLSVLTDWADNMRAEAAKLQQQAESLRRAADVLENKYLPKKDPQPAPPRNQYVEPVIHP